MRLVHFFLVITFVLCFHFVLSSQNRADNTSWTSVSVSKDFPKGWKATFKPIHRRKNNFSANQNSSIDYALNHKLSAYYAVQIIGRTWFIPDGSHRQFVFADILQTIPIGTSSLLWKNRYRLHYAFDLNENIDPDFMRLDAQLTLKKSWKVIPFVSIEPFLRLDGEHQEIQRIRYIAGGKWKINTLLAITAQYWRENHYNNNSSANINIWVLNLGIKL